ncbi:dual specificity protein phosphatase 5 [Theristicus caerulescens]
MPGGGGRDSLPGLGAVPRCLCPSVPPSLPSRRRWPSPRGSPASTGRPPAALPRSCPGCGGARPTAGMKVTSLDCRQLRKLLRKEPSRCLVLDCRPYLSYSASCLRGSLNVNLNSVVMRRARGGAVPLHFVVPDAAARARLLLGGGGEGTAGTGRLAAVVVLDQGTGHWQKLKKDSTAQIVLNALLSSLPEAGARVCFLKGGYETFNSQYPECCVDGKLISPERTEAERNLTSHCEKQSVNHKPAYDQGGPVEILPFLYLGSAYHASKCEFLANLHITALLNVSRKSSESFKDQYCYKWIPVEDSHTADISSHFQEAIDFIDYVRRTGGKILVHCEAGISRSPTICMAYLMKTKKLRLEEAFDYIKQRRSLISPNFGFMGQLLQYESEILSSTPSPPVASCKREAASFFAEELTLGKNFEGSCFSFPTSVLSSVPIHSPVHQLKLSPMTASSSC